MSNPSIDPAAVVFGAPQAGMPPVEPMEFSARGSHVGSDIVMSILTTGAAGIVLLMLAALIAVLTVAAVPSIRAFGASFLTNEEWRPNELNVPQRTADGKLVLDEDGDPVMTVVPPSFGALPVIYGTTVSSFLALVVAIPVSFGAAIFLIRIAPKFLVAPVSFLIEFLAAIPSIAYGIWGLFVMTPFLQRHLEPWIHSALGRVKIFDWLFYTTRVVGSKNVLEPVGSSPPSAGMFYGRCRGRRWKGRWRWGRRGGRALWKC
jgi:phosphate transport system permease protein